MSNPINDVPLGCYDGPADPAGDAVIERARRDLVGQPKDEIYRQLEAALRSAGFTPRLDGIEILAGQISGSA